jgi:hypothetical protein
MPIALRLHIPGALVGVSRRGDGALRRTRSPYRHCAAHAAEHPLGAGAVRSSLERSPDEGSWR